MSHANARHSQHITLDHVSTRVHAMTNGGEERTTSAPVHDGTQLIHGSSTAGHIKHRLTDGTGRQAQDDTARTGARAARRVMDCGR